MFQCARIPRVLSRAAVLAISLLAGQLPATAEPFRIVVIADSQWASQKCRN